MSVRKNEEPNKSPRLNYFQYTSPLNKLEKQENRLEKLLLEKPQIPHAYTPRENTHNSSLNIPGPLYTPRETPSNFYLPNLQIPSSPNSSPNIVVSPRPLSMDSPKKSYIEAEYDFKREERMHNECQYKYFCCTELYIGYF